MVDTLIQGKTRSRRRFCSFYTESDPILTYMVARLDVQNGDLILEPCAGNGVFIDKIVTLSKHQDFKIDAFELNPIAADNLRGRYHGDRRIKVKETDTLHDATLLPIFNGRPCYSKIIGNPPYGAWLDYDERGSLKKLYGGYVKETYTLFLRKGLDLLKENGRLVFIIPDTFLALHTHRDLRRTLLENTRIEEILLMPSKFFPGVNFGYSNLCIISLVRAYPHRGHKVRIVHIGNSVRDLYQISEGNYHVANHFEEILQNEILASVDCAFLIGADRRIRKLINESKITLGDIAECVTGFYSGDDKTFMATRDHSVKGSKNHKIAPPSIIEEDFLSQEDLLSGLHNGKKYIPILKGGKSVFIKPTEWFIRWDKAAVEHYRKDRKSRFQNSRYYFREGIGVPMVKTKHISAFLLEKRLFDQSIVGIFPKETIYWNYLLAFLNSDICSRILNVINHTANNSANYLKKLPIIYRYEVAEKIDHLLKDFRVSKQTEVAIKRINSIFNSLYKLQNIPSQNHPVLFARTVPKRIGF